MPNLNNQVSGSAIAFIDTQVENYQGLIAGVKAGTEVVVLDGNRDAIDQITQILALRTNIDSIHIVSHGAPGSLELGDGSLSLDDIECDRDSLQQWFSPQTDSRSKNRPNILLYGCSVAAGETGKAFVKRLSELTGASVAASKNLTGSVAKGGDWELEVRTGEIETPLVFEAEVLAGYEYVLNSFGAATNFGAGSGSRGINVGDFNADTFPDLVVTNQNDDNVSILLGNGTGGFGTATNFAVGSSPISVTSGLFNDDNFSDLAVVNSSNISILLANGTGGFYVGNDFNVGNTPLSIAVGNFNTDTFLDLAVVNANPQGASGSVSILLGNGAGSFGVATNFNVGAIPDSVVVGNFNADSFADLAVANGLSNNVSILLGNGTGGFGAATNFGVEQGPNSIATGDFNADNFLDLATVNPNNVSILLGNGTGSFGAATNVSAGAGLNGIVVKDFSGDDRLDLAVTGTSGAAILVGNGNGGFSVPINFAAGTDPTSIIAGNFNADTLPDFAVANNGSDNVSILLNTPNTVSFVPPQIGNTYNVNEGTTATIIDVPVTISGGTPLSDVTVPIVIDASSTATQDADYTLSTTSLTFSAGTTTLTQNIAVTIKADNIVDSNEQIVLNLGAITGGVVGGMSQAKVAILDRNSSYSIIADNLTITEGNSGPTPATFTITRSGSTELWSTVDYAITGTATNDTDYNNIGGTSAATAATGKISFAAGETSKTVTLDVVGDGNIEPDETVAITLSNSVSPGGAPTIATATATATIKNDDTAGITVTPKAISTTEVGGKAEFTVTLNAAPTANVTINLSGFNPAEGTVSTNSLTFTPANYSEQTITVTGVDDDDVVADGAQVYKIVTAAAVSTDVNYNNLDPDDVSVINSDNETPGITVNPTAGLTTGEDGTKANFTVVLNTKPTANVTIGLNSDNVAEGTVSTNSLTFTPVNWDTPQPVTVTGVEDSIVDGDINYKIVTALAVSDDPYYKLDAADVSLSNKDYDTAGISITPTATTATEGGATGSYAIELTSEPIAPVTINFNAGSEINAIAPVTFDSTNWNVAKTVTVTATDDSKAEGTHSGTIAHTSASTDTKYSNLTLSPVTATIADNDPAGVTISPTSTTATEGGANGSYSVQLTSVPSAPVTISFGNGNQINAIADVTFDSTNWNVAKPVTVTAKDDAVVEGNHTGSISHTAQSADSKYSAIPIPGVTVAIADKDLVPEPGGGGTVEEPGGGGTVEEPGGGGTVEEPGGGGTVEEPGGGGTVEEPGGGGTVEEPGGGGTVEEPGGGGTVEEPGGGGTVEEPGGGGTVEEPGGGGTVEEPGGGGTVEEPGGGGTVEEPGGGGTVEEPGGGGTVEEPGGGGTVEEPGGGGTVEEPGDGGTVEEPGGGGTVEEPGGGGTVEEPGGGGTVEEPGGGGTVEEPGGGGTVEEPGGGGTVEEPGGGGTVEEPIGGGTVEEPIGGGGTGTGNPNIFPIGLPSSNDQPLSNETGFATAEADGVFTNELADLTIPGFVGPNAWGDYDNDGDLDLLVMEQDSSPNPLTSSEVTAYKPKVYDNKNGSFEPVDIGLPTVYGGIVRNNNGKADIAQPSATWGDPDKDGDLDILLTGATETPQQDIYPTGSRYTPITRLYRNQKADGITADTLQYPLPDNFDFPRFSPDSRAKLPGILNGSAAWGDYNNDGRQDLVLTGDTGAGYIAKVFRNDPTGFNDGSILNYSITFEEETGANLPGVNGNAAWGDYNKDGKLDILLTGDTVPKTNVSNSSNYIYIAKLYRNTGNGFTEESNALPQNRNASEPITYGAWGDPDNDGRLDILLTGAAREWPSNYWRSGPTRLLQQSYNNSATTGYTFQETAVGAPGSNTAAWGDYDNNGKLDILLTQPANSDSAQVYQQDDFGGSFKPINDAGLPKNFSSGASWGDYDKDGRLDIALTTDNSSGSSKFVTIYHNNTPKANTPPSAPQYLNSSTYNYTEGVKYEGVNLTWYRANPIDGTQTPDSDLSYNLRVWTVDKVQVNNQGGDTADIINYVVGPMSLDNGTRQVVQLGNVNQAASDGSSWLLKPDYLIPGKEYHWSVQAIDGAWAGSPFVEGQPFTFTAPDIQPTVTITATDANAAETIVPPEEPNPGKFTITRTGGSLADPLNVYYRFKGFDESDGAYSNQNNLALPGSYAQDYELVSDSEPPKPLPSDLSNSYNNFVTIPAGKRSVNMVVKVRDDSLVEGDEKVVITLDHPNPQKIGEPSTATVTIADNDPNHPPVLNYGETTTPWHTSTFKVSDSSTFTYTFPENTFTDPDPGDKLTYTATLMDGSPRPSWLNFDQATRTLSGTSPVAQQLTIKLTATDRAGASVSDDSVGDPRGMLLTFGPNGVLIDGYISGATLFLDANKNGVLDTNEPSTTTNSNGNFNLNIPFETFDTNKNGEIDPSEGNLVATGGTDTATGLPLETPVTAPPDSTVVTLLTTLIADLIDKGIEPEEAQSLVKAALSLPAEVDLTSLDPILATNNNQPGGVQVLSAMVKVQNFITQTSALIDGASSAVNTDIVKAVVSSITNQIQSGTVLNLSNAAALEPIIQQSAAKIQQIDPSFNIQTVTQITSQSATVMATANQRIDIAVSNPTAISIPESLARLQQVALGPTTQDFKSVGTGNKQISQLVADNTGTALDSRIEAVVLPTGIATPVVSGDADLGSNSPDAILGTNGDDILSGDSANNVLMGMRGNDSLDGTLGNDTLFGGKGSDTILGGGGDDALLAGRGADILNGDDGNDMLYGGKGDDLLNGGFGIDSLIGGMGVDKFLLSTNSGTDTITDFEVGKDLLVLGNGLIFSQLAIAQDSGATLIRFAQTGEILASLTGVSASSISAVNFGLI